MSTTGVEPPDPCARTCGATKTKVTAIRAESRYTKRLIFNSSLCGRSLNFAAEHNRELTSTAIGSVRQWRWPLLVARSSQKRPEKRGEFTRQASFHLSVLR